MISKSLLIGPALLAAFPLYAKSQGPGLDSDYQSFCQFNGDKGYFVDIGAEQWDFTKGAMRVWFEQDRAQAILQEATTPIDEEFIQSSLKALRFTPDPEPNPKDT
jgi:hypothetical protein